MKYGNEAKKKNRSSAFNNVRIIPITYKYFLCIPISYSFIGF